MKQISIKFFLFFLMLNVRMSLSAQPLDYQNVITIIMDDGTPVTLYGKASDQKMSKISTDNGSIRYTNTSDGKNTINYSDGYYYTGEYYYLPTQLRLGVKNDPEKTPEFLFMKYTTEAKADAGGAQGALMHFLMEWGLQPKQEEEINKKLKVKIDQLRTNPGMQDKLSKVTTPVVVGPVRVKATAKESFRIISATLSDKTTAPVVITSGKAATLPGQKVAVASKLDKIGAQLMAATFEKTRSISDLSIEMNYTYDVLMPAIKGNVTIDWSKLDSLYSFYEKKNFEEKTVTETMSYTESYFWGLYHSSVDYSSTYNYKDYDIKSEKETFFHMLKESRVVDVNITNMAPESEISKAIVTAMLELVTTSLASTSESSESLNEEEEEAQPELVDPSKDRVNFSRTKIKSKSASGKQVINLDYRTTIVEEVSILGNLGSWYNGVRNNKKCVAAINLNDPFFAHRDINFIIDNKVKDVFEEEVNYVTINVRKKRSSGNPYEEQKTIDAEYLKKNGALAQFTYARGEDKNSDNYEYKTQFSLRGGVLYPENPTWKKGDWQGVTLTCPMKPRNIEFEGDLEELKKAGITRATLQLRYMKHGKECESNIPITVSKGEALATKKLFIDEDVPGYAYRLVLTHKEKGKVALDWETKINDDYVYASIPNKLLENDKAFWDTIIDKGKAMLDPNTDGTVKSGNEVLGQFLDVIKVFIDKK
jgi:hypothetical protein